MKRNYKLAILTVVLGVNSIFNTLTAQITIASADMPSVNDTVRLSNASPLTAGIDLTVTGPNTTWDFSQLQWTSQTVDTFHSVSTTGIFAFIFFSSSFATKGPDINAIPGFQVTGVYNFYGKTSTLFQQNAIGAYLNSIPAPMSFTSKDVIYRFPMNFGNQDTSHAVYGLGIPNLGSYNANQTRINDVDGWGNITTPYGSFNCLRIKSTLTGHDSIYVDSLTTGAGFDRSLTREYKWLANGMKVPVLQINTTELIPGNETISSIVYLDSSRVLTVGINDKVDNDLLELDIYPIPATDVINLNIRLKYPDKLHYKLYSSSGQIMFECREFEQVREINKMISTTAFPPGIYMLQVQSASAIYYRQIIISSK